MVQKREEKENTKKGENGMEWNGMATAPAMLPIPLLSAGTKTSIHLHPAGIFEQGNLIFPLMP
ncbi:hypothetical protein [Chryseobacterium sp. JUb7]|uniref:hypothetical protein n=1 Tax=Chryseobacterium sp. JUb7 TaxID=2940599 RepID=UPI0021680EF9|nr:hypothetical protein [Chryseobacterium sp. JUb7]MCS3530753.1 hypothetical protein [Chryseobacterium sp. JUb7]